MDDFSLDHNNQQPTTTQDLIFAYNIGRSEKTQRQILEATAASTGLRLTEDPTSR